MQSFIKLFPLIYSIWGGILIIAGLLLVVGFLEIICKSKTLDFCCRRSDKLNCFAVATITVLNFISLFMRHEEAIYILDALILGHFWCTIYFASIVHLQLSCLPAAKRV